MDTHRLDQAAQRLLLLAARGAWTDTQRAKAVQLAGDVTNWDAFCEVSIRAFGACLAYGQLSGLGLASIPLSILDRMHHVARMVAMRSLQLDAAMLDLKSGCLDPLGIRHAFFKGSALAHRYHDHPASRPSRDVDVLIDPEQAFALVRHARQAGYVPIRSIGPSDRDLAQWMKQETVYGMRSPNGILIEIHESLDHGRGVLDSSRMLDRAETIDFHGRELSVLRTSDLFVYICMHHTRHFWSHLHWYADLDAITGHTSFDLDEVREAAAGSRLLSTVEACLQLNEYARSADWPETLSLERDAAESLLARSIECLEGGPAREVELRATRLSRDHAFVWQTSLNERPMMFVLRVRDRCLKQIGRVSGWVTRRLRAISKRAGAPNEHSSGSQDS